MSIFVVVAASQAGGRICRYGSDAIRDALAGTSLVAGCSAKARVCQLAQTNEDSEQIRRGNAPSFRSLKSSGHGLPAEFLATLPFGNNGGPVQSWPLTALLARGNDAPVDPRSGLTGKAHLHIRSSSFGARQVQTHASLHNINAGVPQLRDASSPYDRILPTLPFLPFLTRTMSAVLHGLQTSELACLCTSLSLL